MLGNYILGGFILAFIGFVSFLFGIILEFITNKENFSIKEAIKYWQWTIIEGLGFLILFSTVLAFLCGIILYIYNTIKGI